VPPLPQRRIDLFDAHSFGPEPVDRQLSPWRREWHRHAVARKLYLSERFVVLVAETAVAYLAFVFGLLVGAALFG
jgi:hypothetical protein